jgi:hypothetical protein
MRSSSLPYKVILVKTIEVLRFDLVTSDSLPDVLHFVDKIHGIRRRPAVFEDQFSAIYRSSSSPDNQLLGLTTADTGTQREWRDRWFFGIKSPERNKLDYPVVTRMEYSLRPRNAAWLGDRTTA